MFYKRRHLAYEFLVKEFKKSVDSLYCLLWNVSNKQTTAIDMCDLRYYNFHKLFLIKIKNIAKPIQKL
jgi:hypothetical protein